MKHYQFFFLASLLAMTVSNTASATLIGKMISWWWGGAAVIMMAATLIALKRNE